MGSLCASDGTKKTSKDWVRTGDPPYPRGSSFEKGAFTGSLRLRSASLLFFFLHVHRLELQLPLQEHLIVFMIFAGAEGFGVFRKKLVIF